MSKLLNLATQCLHLILQGIDARSQVIATLHVFHLLFHALHTLFQASRLSGLLLGVGITLVDFKLEFGRLWENDEMRIILADEISPDNCRLWDSKTNEKMDKDRFRRDLGKVEEAYQEVARRLGILIDQGPGDVRGPTTLQ